MINRPVDLDAQEKILKMTEDSQLRVAERRQKLGEESTQKALLYSAIGNLGKSISSAIAGSPEQQQRLDNAYTNALQATTSIRPSTLVISPGSAIGQRNYFK
jgi:hypothetical protein